MRISKERKLCLAMKYIDILNLKNKANIDQSELNGFVEGMLFTLSALDIDTKFLGDVQRKENNK